MNKIYTKLITGLLFVLGTIGVRAQVSTGYAWTQSAGTFAPIAPAGTPAALFPTSWNDQVVTAQAIGFTFNYNGTAYTTVSISANGFMVFGSTLPACIGGCAYSNTSDDGFYLAGTGQDNGVAGVNMDLREQLYAAVSGTVTSGSPIITGVSVFTNIRVGMRLTGTGITSGTIVTAFNPGAGTVTMSANATATSSTTFQTRSGIVISTIGSGTTKTCVIQFVGARRWGSAAGTADNIDFQIRLNEANDVAVNQSIDVVFGTVTTSNATSNIAQTGIRTTTGDVNSRTTAANWTSTTTSGTNTAGCTFSSSVFPPSGRTFTWTPVPPLANDLCIGAIAIPCDGSVNGDNTTATNDALPGITCGSALPTEGNNKGVWFTVTPANSGPMTISTCTGTAWDTYLRVYTGTCGSFTACAGYDDDGCSPQSSLTFTAVGGTTYYILLGGFSGSDYGAYTISTTCTSSCPVPTAINITGITTTAANVNFTSGGTSFIVEYGAPGFVPGTGGSAGTGTIVTGEVSPILLSGLTSSSTYDVYVRQVCVGPIYSANSGVVSFNTLCTNQALPGSQGFNTSGSSVFPACWSQQAVVGTSTISFQTISADPATTPYEGPGTRYVYWNSNAYPAGDETRLVSRAITTTGIPSVDVSFRWYNENNPLFNSGSYLNEGVQVQYSLDGIIWMDAGSFIPRHDGSLSSGTGSWMLKTVTLPAGAGNKPTIFIGFKFHSEFGDNCSLDALNISSTGTLPTGLISFSGYKDGSRNQLRWTTGSEQNNSGFEVQRSTDGVNYSPIGFVNSLAINGNNLTQLNYAFADNSVTESRQYYRLRQVDFDGHSKLSQIIQIKDNKPVMLMIDGLFPNPASTLLNVLIAAPNKDKVTLAVTDVEGRKVIELVVSVESGSNTIPVDISKLANGTYMVKLICTTNCEGVVGKFVKQ